MKKIILLLNTVRFLSIRQIIYRLWYFCRNIIWKNRKSKRIIVKDVKPISEYYKKIAIDKEIENNANKILNNQFTTISFKRRASYFK